MTKRKLGSGYDYFLWFISIVGRVSVSVTRHFCRVCVGLRYANSIYKITKKPKKSLSSAHEPNTVVVVLVVVVVVAIIEVDESRVATIDSIGRRRPKPTACCVRKNALINTRNFVFFYDAFEFINRWQPPIGKTTAGVIFIERIGYFHCLVPIHGLGFTNYCAILPTLPDGITTPR